MMELWLCLTISGVLLLVTGIWEVNRVDAVDRAEREERQVREYWRKLEAKETNR